MARRRLISASRRAISCSCRPRIPSLRRLLLLMGGGDRSFVAAREPDEPQASYVRRHLHRADGAACEADRRAGAGGASYFHYALEALHACAVRNGTFIAVLPGDSKPDPGLTPFSNVALEDLNALWSYLIEGGDANSRAFLGYAEAMLSGAEKPAPAAPLMKAESGGRVGASSALMSGEASLCRQQQRRRDLSPRLPQSLSTALSSKAAKPSLLKP